jgi:hypothetical protein
MTFSHPAYGFVTSRPVGEVEELVLSPPLPNLTVRNYEVQRFDVTLTQCCHLQIVPNIDFSPTAENLPLFISIVS